MCTIFVFLFFVDLFYLTLIDGSSICNRLSVQINKICNDLKNLVESLNQTNRECGVYEDVLYKDALDVNSRIYLNTTTVDQVIL